MRHEKSRMKWRATTLPWLRCVGYSSPRHVHDTRIHGVPRKPVVVVDAYVVPPAPPGLDACLHVSSCAIHRAYLSIRVYMSTCGRKVFLRTHPVSPGPYDALPHHIRNPQTTLLRPPYPLTVPGPFVFSLLSRPNLAFASSLSPPVRLITRFHDFSDNWPAATPIRTYALLRDTYEHSYPVFVHTPLAFPICYSHNRARNFSHTTTLRTSPLPFLADVTYLFCFLRFFCFCCFFCCYCIFCFLHFSDFPLSLPSFSASPFFAFGG